MGLGLYHKADPTTRMDSLDPFRVTFDGRLEGRQALKIYLRNDDTSRFYTDIKVQAVDTLPPNIVDGTQTGFFWKLAEKDLIPTPEEWALIQPGNQITISSQIGSSTLGDIITFIPIWVQLAVPRGLDIQTIKDVVLRITATENLI